MPDTITDEKIEAVALAIFKAEQEITAEDGDKLPDRHFKVAIIVYAPWRGPRSKPTAMADDHRLRRIYLLAGHSIVYVLLNICAKSPATSAPLCNDERCTGVGRLALNSRSAP